MRRSTSRTLRDSSSVAAAAPQYAISSIELDSVTEETAAISPFIMTPSRCEWYKWILVPRVYSVQLISSQPHPPPAYPRASCHAFSRRSPQWSLVHTKCSQSQIDRINPSTTLDSDDMVRFVILGTLNERPSSVGVGPLLLLHVRRVTECFAASAND